MFESDFLTSNLKATESYEEFLNRAIRLVTSAMPEKPYRGASANELAPMLSFDFLGPASRDALVNSLRLVLEHSINVAHPRTIAHLHCPPLIASLAAEAVIAALNQSMDSFDQAPFATVLEQKLIAWICSQAGLPGSADGTFTTGGTQSNYQGLLLARDAFARRRWNWSVQKAGLPPEWTRLRVLCSDVAHFTVEKSASQLGLGTDAVIRIPVDAQFRMRIEALSTTLESLSKQDLLPFAIVATAGTTDFGSIDPLPDIADLAHSAGAWLHVDAAYGGALLFSSTHRGKLTGTERADSISIDFHKLLWQPIPCSVFLVRDRRNFESMRLHADYLNPETHEEQGIPNLVTHSLLTSRRFDALKLWISLQALGFAKLDLMLDRTLQLAAYAAQVIQKSDRLQLVHEPELSAVVFRYLPSGGSVDPDQINRQLRQRLFDSGSAVIGHTRVNGRQCLKFTCMNPTMRDDQVEELVRDIVDMGDRIERELQ
ncbi:MAG TPA: aspartate aminotransferase family protein [Candidatus Sulfotelmatobacter sp.]|nr:aspartate aminotransferase family protein [Candidatus Sulfotelmatobacter sp.]